MKLSDLRALPAVLSKNDLLRETGKSDDVLRVSINRWVKQGVLKKAGARTGMYYNLVRDPEWQNHVLVAVERKYPSAMLAGPSVLHAHGLQTQIPSAFHVAVLAQRTLPEMDNVVWMPRPRSWFAQFVPEESLYGLRSLSPLQALEDGFLYQDQSNSWKPDVDDIEWDELGIEPDFFAKKGAPCKP